MPKVRSERNVLLVMNLNLRLLNLMKVFYLGTYKQLTPSGSPVACDGKPVFSAGLTSGQQQNDANTEIPINFPLPLKLLASPSEHLLNLEH